MATLLHHPFYGRWGHLLNMEVLSCGNYQVGDISIYDDGFLLIENLKYLFEATVWTFVSGKDFVSVSWYSSFVLLLCLLVWFFFLGDY